MLIRLIIAVFGLVLVFGLGSNALAGPGLISHAEEPARFIPGHPKLDAVEDARPVQPSFKKPVSARITLPPGAGVPGAPQQKYFCDFQNYAGSQFYIWSIPDPYGDDLFNTRFTVEDNFRCTLKAAYPLFYGPAMTGTPDARIYLWATDGFGFPGALLDSFDVPYATLLANGYGYAFADFSAPGWTFDDVDEYHYGFTTLGGAGDVLWILSDDGVTGPHTGETRSSEFYLGAWGTMLNDWGIDVVFDIFSERCCEEIPFSDCYTQTYWASINFFWRTPHPVFGDTAWAMRFDVGGPETLQSVDIYIFDHTVVGLTEPAGDDAVTATVYDDDGFGQPGATRAQVTIPGGSYPLFPSATNFSFAPLVLENTFHVAFSTSGVGGKYESTLSDNGAIGTGRSNGSGDPGWPGATTWYTMLAWWGADYNFMFEANLCRDEFSLCSIQNYFVSFDVVYPIPDNNPVIEFAQRFKGTGGAECDLRQLDLCFYRHPAFDGPRPGMYTKNTAINLYANVGGFPAVTPFHTIILTPADYAAAGYTGPAFFGAFLLTIPNLNVLVPPSFFVGYEALTGTRDSGIRVCIDNTGGAGQPVGGMVINAPAFGGWLPSSALGFVGDAALFLGVKLCCTPFPGAVCLPPDTWATQSHDLGRTGASNVALDDAWCDLTTSWYYETPANTIPYMSPIVHDGRVYVSTSSSAGNASTVEVLDLISGVNLYTISDTSFGNFILNDPTIIGNTMYVSGGDKRSITAWDISGVPFKVMTRHFGGAVGPLRFANTIVLNIGGVDVVYAGSEVGRVVAIDAATGANYGGWSPNPITLDAGQRIGGAATDGTDLYYTTRIGGLVGDIYSISALTGGKNWQLAFAGGHQATVVYPTENVTSEGFTNVSVDDGVVYGGGRVVGDFPADGVLYRLASATGAVLSASQANAFLYSNPIIDINRIYCQTISGWIGGTSVGTPLTAYSKNNGALLWSSETIYESDWEGRYWGNGARSCEPEDGPFPEDIIVNTDEEGVINFWNTITGAQLFRRRWDFGQDISDGAGATLASDSLGATHVLVNNGFGAVVNLVKGADRPRLEIQDYDPSIPIEFSVATSEIDSIFDAIVNTGCADLTFTAVNVSDISNGSSDPLIVSTNIVRQELLDRSAELASKLAAVGIFKGTEANIINISGELSMVSVRELAQNNERFISRSATAFPAYLNSVVEPFNGQVLIGGDTLDLILDVNPSLIDRGPQIFYIELVTTDPDFFVNAGSIFLPAASPEITVTLVGGCLTDTTALRFGPGGVSYRWITNTGRLADGDWDAHGVDYGDGIPSAGNSPDLEFQGTYVFGVSTERIAMNANNWFGQSQANSWFSIQGDPNYCDNDCKPALMSGVNLGAIWDGSSHVPILGNMICKSWIDSVQNYDDGGGWDWRNYGSPFDNALTMGLSANTRTVGALDVARLSRFVVEIFEITERNGNSVPDWKFAMNMDYDVAPFISGNADTAILDASISAAWTTDAVNAAGVDFAWGVIKLPFGCGFTPMKNTKGLDSDQGHFESNLGRGDPYWDSAYIYMSLAAGEYSHPLTAAPQDQQFHATLIEHDFGPNDTLVFASALFGLSSGVTDPSADGGGGEIADLANIANKWVGFGRGDVDDDGIIGLADIMVVAGIANAIPGVVSIPFEHLADVNIDGAVNALDVDYLVNYYFFGGPCPEGDWTL